MPNFENYVQKDLVTDAVLTESNEEFILPDYMPEIGRVLRVCASLLPDEPFLGTEGAELSGRIEYRLLYADGEGVVTEAPLEGHYRYRLAEREAHAPVLYTEEEIESVAARPTAPRKLTVRTRVKARPALWSEVAVGTSLSALVGEAPVETKKTILTVTDRCALSLGSARREGRLTVSDVTPETLSLLSVRAEPMVESCASHDGYVSVSGRIAVTLLLSRGGVPFTESLRLPFEEEIPCARAKEGDLLSLRAFAAAPSVSFEEEGEATAVLTDCDFSLFGVLFAARTLSVLSDVYVHGETHAIEHRPLTGERLINAVTGNVTVSGDVPFPIEGAEGKCLLPSFRVKESTVTAHGDRATVEGVLSVTLLAFGEKGGDACECALPFRAELPLGAHFATGDRMELRLAPVGGTARATKTALCLSTELSLSLLLFRPYACAVPVSAVKTGELAAPAASTVTVYYPTDGDTLWTVGKKYGIPLSRVREQNGLPTEGEPDGEEDISLDGYSYLLIEGL